MALPTLPNLPSLRTEALFLDNPGFLPNPDSPEGRGVNIRGGGLQIGFPGGSVTTTNVSSGLTGMAGRALSSVLGIPAINWGRIAAFLLGLLLIAAGILGMVFGTKNIKTVVITGAKQAVKAATTGAEAA